MICIWHPKALPLLGLINETKKWMMNIKYEVFIDYEIDIKTSISKAIWLNVLYNIYIYYKN